MDENMALTPYETREILFYKRINFIIIMLFL